MRPRSAPLLAFAVWLAAVPALGAEAAAPAELRVHDRVGYAFTAPDGAHSAAERAAEASKNFEAAVDERVPGALAIDVLGDRATVRVGARPLFALVPADATAEGARNLPELATRLKPRLASFLTQERRRARLQRGVLGASLVVFFAVLTLLLLRWIRRRFLSWEERISAGEAALPKQLAWLRLGGQDGAPSLLLQSVRARGLLLLGVMIARLFAQALVVYLFLLGSLSVFEGTEDWRAALNVGVAAPFIGLAQRLGRSAPEALLLLIVVAVIRGGFRVSALGFEQLAKGQLHVAGVAPEKAVSYRLLARVALIVGALLLVPALLAGDESGLFPRVGLVAIAGIGLCLVPLGATVAVGVFSLLGGLCQPGDWIRVTLPGGRELVGEVTSVDFFHLRLVPKEGGEIRVPHLATLWHPLTRLRAERDLVVELTVARQPGPLQPLLDRLAAAAQALASVEGLTAPPELSLLELLPGEVRVRVALPLAHERARSALLVALAEAADGRGVAPPAAPEGAG
ncbi:MAG: hypothetical protein ACYCWW_06135 [Deltaproteobacteria bacterium]